MSVDPTGPRRRTSGHALAAIFFGLTLFLFPLAIWAGLRARADIKRSGGRLEGARFANWGLGLGVVSGVACVTIGVLLATGVLDETNADDFRGEARLVAQAIDDVETAYEQDDGEYLCGDLFTPRYARGFESVGVACAEEVVERPAVSLDAERIDVRGDRATATVLEDGVQRLWMLRRGGSPRRWRLDDVTSS